VVAVNVLKWVNPDVAALQPYEPGRPIEEVAREFGLDSGSICKLASNENPLGVSPKAIAAIRDQADKMFRYPDGGGYYLRSRLAEKHCVDFGEVILGNGSNEIIEFIGHCFFGPDRSIVVSAHAFVIYKLLARMFSTTVIEVPTIGLAHDPVAMADSVREDTSVVFVCNPNNPTGTMIESSGVATLMDRVPDDVLVVFDEAYAEIAVGPMPDTLPYVRAGRNCVLLRTFSKAYGLAGLRIGYGLGPAAIVSALQKPRQPFNVNSMAQAAALAALDDDDFLCRTRSAVAQGKQQMEDACRRLGLPFQPTCANFMLVTVGDGARVADAMARRGVIVRPMAGYGLPETVRVTFGTTTENEHLISCLEEVVAGLN